jgi:hypothetical protein
MNSGITSGLSPRLNGTKIRMVFAPEGLQDSAQGFNPGNLKINEFALKGREAIR